MEKIYQAYSIAVIDTKGNIIDEINNHKDKEHFYDSMKKFQKRYGLTACKNLTNTMLLENIRSKQWI